MRHWLPLLLAAWPALGCTGNEPSRATGTSSGDGGAASGAGVSGSSSSGGLAGTSAGAGASSAGAPGSAGAAGSGPEPFQTENLLVNGDAENGAVAWLPLVATLAVQTEKYGAEGYPGVSDVGPGQRDLSFFYGGPSATADSHQLVDVSAFASRVDAGLRFTLSAYLGGYATQDDRVSLVVVLLAADGSSLETETLGGPYAAERFDTTALLAHKLDAKLPLGTRAIDVHMVMTRAAGSGDDGYADNLTLTLHN